HFQQRGEFLLAQHAAIRPGYLAVAPDIDFDRIEMAAREIGDFLLCEIDAHQLAAVRAAVLSEIQEEALALRRCIARVFPDVEKGLLEPGRYLDRVGAGFGRGARRDRCRGQGYSERRDQYTRSPGVCPCRTVDARGQC